jgi:hypothetical protein
MAGDEVPLGRDEKARVPFRWRAGVPIATSAWLALATSPSGKARRSTTRSTTSRRCFSRRNSCCI